MRIIGLCGASEASREMVALRLRTKYGVPTINVERASEMVTAKNTKGLDMVIEEIGEVFLKDDGSLDKKMIAEELVKKGKGEALRVIISNAINQMMADSMKKLENAGHKVVVVNYGYSPHMGYEEQIILGGEFVELKELEGSYFLESTKEEDVDILLKEILK